MLSGRPSRKERSLVLGDERRARARGENGRPSSAPSSSARATSTKPRASPASSCCAATATASTSSSPAGRATRPSRPGSTATSSRCSHRHADGELAHGSEVRNYDVIDAEGRRREERIRSASPCCWRGARLAWRCRAASQAAPPKRIVALTPFAANTLAKLGVTPVGDRRDAGRRRTLLAEAEGRPDAAALAPERAQPRAARLARPRPRLLLADLGQGQPGDGEPRDRRRPARPALDPRRLRRHLQDRHDRRPQALRPRPAAVDAQAGRSGRARGSRSTRR